MPFKELLSLPCKNWSMSKFQNKNKNRNNCSKGGGKNTPFKKRIFKNPKNKTVKEGMRLNQFIAHAGICSRREADQFIAAGLVSINDEVVTGNGVSRKTFGHCKIQQRTD